MSFCHDSPSSDRLVYFYTACYKISQFVVFFFFILYFRIYLKPALSVSLAFFSEVYAQLSLKAKYQ